VVGRRAAGGAAQASRSGRQRRLWRRSPRAPEPYFEPKKKELDEIYSQIAENCAASICCLYAGLVDKKRYHKSRSGHKADLTVLRARLLRAGGRRSGTRRCGRRRCAHSSSIPTLAKDAKEGAPAGVHNNYLQDCLKIKKVGGDLLP